MSVSIRRGQNFQVEMQMVTETCCNCGIAFAITTEFKNEKLKKRGAEGEAFYCPRGHAQHYVGLTDVQKLERERDRLKEAKSHLRQRLQREEARADHERAKARGYKGHAAKLRKQLEAPTP